MTFFYIDYQKFLIQAFRTVYFNFLLRRPVRELPNALKHACGSSVVHADIAFEIPLLVVQTVLVQISCKVVQKVVIRLVALLAFVVLITENIGKRASFAITVNDLDALFIHFTWSMLTLAMYSRHIIPN